MKLFGTHRGADHVSPDGRRLSGAAKGLIGIAIALCVLVLVGLGIYKASVKPVERPTVQEKPTIETPTETVKKPTVIVPEVTVDEETGEAVWREVEIPASYKEGVYNILICGTDGDGFRTDTIIIAHLDVNTHETALLSIPRDTVVPRADGGIMKINSVYAGGKEAGMERLATRLAAMLGFEVDGFVLIDLEAFVKTVDLVGGVWFDVPQDMYYVDKSQDLYIDLKQGEQLLDGEQAMGLVRYRKGYASQDIRRTEVQQEFLKALAKQCLKIENVTKIQEFIDIFASYVTTDLTVGNMIYYAQALLQCDFDDMKTYTAQGEGATINGGSYYPLYAGKLLEIVNESFNPYETAITLDNISIITPDVARTYQKPDEQTPEPPADPELPDDTEQPTESDEPPASEDAEDGTIWDGWGDDEEGWDDWSGWNGAGWDNTEETPGIAVP